MIYLQLKGKIIRIKKPYKKVLFLKMDAVSSLLDKKTLIHATAELIIVAGVTFWLNSKINGQNDAIVKLQKENAELKARLEAIEQFLRQATGGGGPPPPPPSSKKKKQPMEADPGTQSEEEVMSSSDEEIEI